MYNPTRPSPNPGPKILDEPRRDHDELSPASLRRTGLGLQPNPTGEEALFGILSISCPYSLRWFDPGHPSLLTVATHDALTKYADFVLSEKLVPAAVLALIPVTIEVRVARKFPGNTEGAQSEIMDTAVEAARRGLTVVRLKQGDPVVYGRAGEEVLPSTRVQPLVVPGVSSVLAAPIFAGIPVTQRGVAESVVVGTGVGRQAKEAKLPGYERSRTVLILMGVARIAQVVGAMIRNDSGSGEGLQSGEGRREGIHTLGTRQLSLSSAAQCLING
ncbi:tetrapyrrole methylase [Suillus occidentalis]|nr:tetrapyrrole methylase [Suillus occidentalis]